MDQKAIDSLVELKLRRQAEDDFYTFVQQAWHVIEGGKPFVGGFATKSMCEHLEEVYYGRILRLRINIPPRFTKALDNDTPILTLHGWKKHGDLFPGDFVFSPEGKPIRVLGCTEVFEDESYEVVFDDGSIIVAAREHLWEIEKDVLDKKKWNRKRERDVVKTIDLISMVSSGNRHNRNPRVKINKPVELVPQNLLVDPYVMGAWIGDGFTATGSMCSGYQDIDNFKTLGNASLIRKSNNISANDYWRITIPGLSSKLRVMDVLGKAKHIPKEYLFGSIEQRIALLQGLMDTDGTCTTDGTCRFTTKYNELAKQFLCLIQSLGLKGRIHTPKMQRLNGKLCGPYYLISFSPACEFPIFQLKRKQDRVKKSYSIRVSNRYIEAINPIGKRKVKCITVEGDLYLAGECLVTTHNSTCVSVLFPVWCWIKNPSEQMLTISYLERLAIRDNVKSRRLIKSDWFQKRWGERFKISADQDEKNRIDNMQGGYRVASGLDSGITGEGGSLLILDDPNNVKDQGDTALDNALDVYQNVLPTRYNDFKTGRFIVVQQRTSTRDISGYIEAHEKEFVNLILPMEFEESRRCVTVPLKSTNGEVWQDPRQKEGDLLCPERIAEKELQRLKRALGNEYACTPYEAPILMGDLSLKPIGEIRVGDEVIGWALNDEPIEKSSKYGRQHLKRTKVIDVFSSVKPIVRITLDSGEVIRCTPDHKWYVRWKSDRGHLAYQPAAVGRGLCRICPPRLPILSPEDERDAGWLAGFFDGEGTVSMCGKEAGYRASAAISFFQGAGRNKPICDRLEAALKRFGFEFHIYEDMRSDKKNCDMYPYRHYKLKGIGLPVFQRFLHTIRQTKWRQRMMDGALGAKFIQGHEKVISIDPDGEDIVYSLKTETGNYVVWGLASKNCAGQLQQRPAPMEGGMIKRAWWKAWKEAQPPQINYTIQAWDTATSEKDTAAYSACLTFGMFKDDHEHDSLILLSAWRKKVEFPELYKAVQRMAKDYRATTEERPINPKYAPDLILVEEKSSGIQLIQTFNKTGISLVGWRPDKYGDKIERVRRVTHLLETGRVYVPYKSPDFIKPMQYADLLINQCALFPKGDGRDFVDCLSMVLQRCINSGWILHSMEQSAAQEDEWRREHYETEGKALY